MVSAHVSGDRWQREKNNESSSSTVSLSPVHTHSPKLLLCLQVPLVCLRPHVCFTHPHFVFLAIHPSIQLSVRPNLWTPGRRRAGKVIYSSFQDAASSSICSTPTLFWSLHRYETGAWVVISSTCRRLVRSEMTCTVLTYTTTCNTA